MRAELAEHGLHMRAERRGGDPERLRGRRCARPAGQEPKHLELAGGERLDGTGYPDGLRAEQIPLEVRIVTVADRFEALLADRPDRPAVSESEAVRILQGAVARGELDAAVVAALATQVRAYGGN